MAAILGNCSRDLMIEILSMLPAESLLKFKYVCKSWYALISDPHFVRKHLSHLPQQDHLLLKRSNERMQNVFSIFTLNRFDSFVDVNLPFDFTDFLICGHSHGLVCLSDKFSVFLCNPTTKELRKLPPSIFLPTNAVDDSVDPNAVGFGYDPKSKDFKVVRMVDYYGYKYVHFRRVEIYELSKNRWREIQCLFSAYASWTPCFQMYSEGKYYWLADICESTEMILIFDLSEEVFDRILVPQEIKQQHHGDRSYGVLNGSVLIGNYDKEILHIWKINKDGWGYSCSKLFTINGLRIEIMESLLFVSHDKLLVETKHGRVILFNMKTHDFQRLPILGHPFKFQATFFLKSLVSVKGGQGSYRGG